MSSLKSRILVSFTASLLIFLIIFAVTVFFGFNLSLKDWNRANEEKVITEITENTGRHLQERKGRPGIDKKGTVSTS